jgi:hypothetical protein
VSHTLRHVRHYGSIFSLSLPVERRGTAQVHKNTVPGTLSRRAGFKSRSFPEDKILWSLYKIIAHTLVGMR